MNFYIPKMLGDLEISNRFIFYETFNISLK